MTPKPHDFCVATLTILRAALVVVLGLVVGCEGIEPTADAAAPPCTASACAVPAGDARVAQGKVELGPRQPRLLEFEMPGCAACATMAPVMRQLESKCAHGRDVVRHVDVVAPDGEALASRYGVRVLPTFVAVDAEGAEVMRLSGVQQPEKIAAVLTEITGDGCRVD
jgi:hypothetical protein